MSDTLSLNKLEKIIELEDSLRAEYQGKLEAKSAEVERLQKELAELREQLQGTIDTQLEKIASLSEKATNNQQIEQSKSNRLQKNNKTAKNNSLKQLNNKTTKEHLKQHINKQ